MLHPNHTPKVYEMFLNSEFQNTRELVLHYNLFFFFLKRAKKN